MRDRNDNVVIICSIENIDPMGVHTGDSVTVAPQQTLSDRQYQKLRDQAITVIRAVGVETGGSNIQFAVNPETDEIVVIEMNPRVSRSLGAGLEGHRLPDRQDRRPARRRLRARGDRQRHHPRHAGQLRADDRLRGRQVAALRVREVPRRRRLAVDLHAVGRRGDGDRAHVQAGVRQGDALARARRDAAGRRGRPRSCSTRLEIPSHDRYELLFEAVRRGVERGGALPAHGDRPLVHGRDGARSRAARTPRRGSSAPSRRSTPAPPSSRPRRPTTTPAGSARGPTARATRCAAATTPSVVILGSGPEPDRPGHRVRLLLRARGDDRARVRAATR